MEEHKIQQDRIKSVDQRNVVATNDFEDMRKRIVIESQYSPCPCPRSEDYIECSNRSRSTIKTIIFLVVCLLIVVALIVGVIWLCR